MEVVVYQQIRVKRWNYDRTRPYELGVGRATLRPPTVLDSDAIVVKLTLDIDPAAFLPISPAVTITIPAEHVGMIEAKSEPVQVPE